MQLLQATVTEADHRSSADRVAYLVEIDAEVLKRTFEEANDRIASSRGIKAVQTAIAGAFAGRSLIWDTPISVDEDVPQFDPILKQEGIRLWIKPVFSKGGACFYLVG